MTSYGSDDEIRAICALIKVTVQVSAWAHAYARLLRGRQQELPVCVFSYACMYVCMYVCIRGF